MMTAESVRAAFPDSAFGAPCSGDDIAAAERRLGHPLPQFLRELYEHFDGFTGPADAQFLFPLAAQPASSTETLVGYTLFLREEGDFPRFVQRAVALGEDGTGAQWLAFCDGSDAVVLWNAECGDTYDHVPSLLDSWREVAARYDALRRLSAGRPGSTADSNARSPFHYSSGEEVREGDIVRVMFAHAWQDGFVVKVLLAGTPQALEWQSPEGGVLIDGAGIGLTVIASLANDEDVELVRRK